MTPDKSFLPLGRDAWKELSRLPCPLSSRVAYAWRAFWFDINWRLQYQRFAEELPPELPPLVFILGVWRSGTTMLHDLLGLSEGLTSPRTWQCLRPERFALRGPPAVDMRMPRPMDGLEISLLSPQEDEFAMFALGGPSVYSAFVQPSLLASRHELLSQAYWLEKEPRSWMEPWSTFLRLVARAAPTQPLLLKSPTHTFRIRALLRAFPTAKLIWLCRDPHAVQASNRKMWNAMFARYGLGPATPGALDTFLQTAQSSAMHTLESLCDDTPRSQLAVLHYEALTQNPEAMLAALCTRLALPAPDAGRVRQYLTEHAGIRPSQYPAEEPASSALFASVRAQHERAWQSHGLTEV